jgi:heavy metal translocating P-type ATPase
MWNKEEKITLTMLFLSLVALILSLCKITLFSFDFAWIAIMLCGLPIIKEALVGLVTKFDIKADVLVSMALVASVVIGEIFAAGEVAFIMTLGALLEEHTVAKARSGIEKLVHLTPTTARIINDGQESVVDASKVQIGDMVRVLPGETIAVDGIIIAGATSIDQSVMTGEPIPVDKTVDEDVFSGTVNQFGAFDMQATKIGEDSSLQRMVKLVQSADAGKAKIVGMADRWATWIVVIALLAAMGTWFMTGEIIRSVTVLVVFCPCALVLATPTAIMAGIGNATKYGILIREGDALERLAKVNILTFDKTGTLTYGKPTVKQVIGTENFDQNMLLQYVASLESKSEHPLGKAIAAYYKGMKGNFMEVTNFLMAVGKGVRGTVDGKDIIVGNEELLLENHIIINEVEKDRIEQLKGEGAIVIHAVINSTYAGAIALADVLRDEAKDMVVRMHQNGLECVLMTGDEEKAAKHIAAKVGIKKVLAKCLPETKMQTIREYQEKGKKVCMIGDGVNDAPSLKAANVGIAMGGIGSDIAIDASDIALISDDIKYLPHLIALSKKTMKTININLVLSMTLNFIAIILAMTGILNPIVGALVHNVGSIAVVIHSSLLLNWRK